MKTMQRRPEWNKGHSRINPTVGALMGRGVDSITASELHREKWTLGKLQQESVETLQALGLRNDAIQSILHSERPPIPFGLLAEVLTRSSMVCCVCNKPERGVVVHHIEDWALSRSHEETNLAALCLIDHDRAHSKLAHTQNLTAALIREFKKKWQLRVEEMGTRVILSASAADFACWWYFNRIRLFELAESVSVDLKNLAYFRRSSVGGWINDEGYPLPKNSKENYSLYGGDGGLMYAYLKHVLEESLQAMAVINISDDLDRAFLKSVLRPGHLVFLQGSFRFVEKTNRLEGPGQTVEMYRHANGVRVTSTIDRWEATSNSAWASYLQGIYEVSALMRVVSLSWAEDGLTVKCSSIAIGAPFEGMKKREYANAPYRRGYSRERFHNDDEAENLQE